MYSEEKLKEWMEEESLQFTENCEDAVYILPEGKMISAYDIWQNDEKVKVRGVEHNAIDNH